jgi:hypothetical protein
LKSIIIIFAALLLTAALPFVFSSIDNTLSDDITQTFAGISVSGNYSANMTLGKSLFLDSLNYVNSVSSNVNSDSPSAYSYNSVSKVLTVSGLDSGASLRTLSINYSLASATLPSGMSTFLSLLHWFWVFIIIGMTGGAIYAFFD